MEALAWLARVDVAGIEPLGLAMGFGHRATYSHVARLRRAGLVERAFDPGGSVVAITPAGRRAVAAERAALRAGAMHGFGLRHARAVSWMAAHLTLREREWSSERELRGQPAWEIPVIWTATRGRHRPDLGVTYRGARLAVEVELSLKSPRRLQAIFSGYRDAIETRQLTGGVIYVCDRTDVLAAVHRAADWVGMPTTRFRTRSLADIQTEVRRRATERLEQRSVPPSRAPVSRRSEARDAFA